jgi:hypothetical protein
MKTLAGASRIFCSLLFLFSMLSCGTQGPTGANGPGNQGPNEGAGTRILLKFSDVSVDRKQTFTRFTVQKSVSRKTGISVKFELDELDSLPIRARESFLVPFFNGEEIWNAQWPLDSVTPFKKSEITAIDFSADELNQAEIRCRRNPELFDKKELTFKLRVVFSDTTRLLRNNLAWIEVPLVP